MIIDAYAELIKLSNDYIIKGIFISLLIIILFRLILKNIIDTDYSLKIIRLIMIIYSLGVLANMILMLVFSDSENNSFIDRATGPYWWAYWLMISMNALFPLLLLIKKLGNKILFLLLVAIMMNIGWLFESFVIHMTSFDRNYSNENYNPYFPNSREASIIINGVILGLLIWMIGNGLRWWANKKPA